MGAEMPFNKIGEAFRVTGNIGQEIVPAARAGSYHAALQNAAPTRGGQGIYCDSGFRNSRILSNRRNCFNSFCSRFTCAGICRVSQGMTASRQNRSVCCQNVFLPCQVPFNKNSLFYTGKRALLRLSFGYSTTRTTGAWQKNYPCYLSASCCPFVIILCLYQRICFAKIRITRCNGSCWRRDSGVDPLSPGTSKPYREEFNCGSFLVSSVCNIM